MSKISNHINHINNPDSQQNISNHAMETGGGYELMTESEVIQFLRIPEISDSQNFHNVIEHLKRHRDLPRIYICNKALYPKKAIMEWVEKETSN